MTLNLLHLGHKNTKDYHISVYQELQKKYQYVTTALKIRCIKEQYDYGIDMCGEYI